MYPIFVEASGNITEAVRNHTGKEPERMNRLRKIFKNMKYRHKLTIFLVVTSLVPMTVLAWYSHSRLSTMYYGPQQRTGRYAVDHGTDQRKH